MENYIGVIAGGIYTLIYLIVFFIQKAQIDKMKEVNSSIKSFFEVFSVEEVKKYVEMKSETTLMKATSLIMDDEKMEGLVERAIDKSAERIREVYLKQLSDQIHEMLPIIGQVIKNLPKEKRKEFVEKRLKIHTGIYLKWVKELEEREKNQIQ